MKLHGVVMEVLWFEEKRVVHISFPFAEELYRELRFETDDLQVGDSVELQFYSHRKPLRWAS